MKISKAFNNLKIGVRLGFGFGIIILVTLAGFVFVQGKMDKMSEDLSDLYEHPFTVSRAVDLANVNIVRIHRSMKDVTLANNQVDIAAAVEEVNKKEREVLDALNVAKEKFLGNPKEINDLIENFIAWKFIRDEVISLTKNGDKESAAMITKNKGAEHVALLENSIKKLVDFAANKAQEFKNEAIIYHKEAKEAILIVILFIVILSILIATLITRSIIIPLSYAISIADNIARKNLASTLQTNGRSDEVGNLLKSFGKMSTNFREQIIEINEGVNVLASSTSEVMAAVNQLASSSAETATSVGETSTTVEEVKQTAEISSHKAKEVSESAANAAGISKEGTQAIENTINGMNKIKQQMESIASMVVNLSEQSQAVGEITTTVNDLAEQSNLLAVNAAIESAKAGEQGKGFTVVAQEIKNLAERSKEATTQVRGILKDIQKSISSAVMATEEGGKAVAEGLKLTEISGETIRTLSESVAEASNVAIQISASSHQQLNGMDQIASAMENIKEASTQGAASTQQAASSIGDLQKLNDKLKGIIIQYKIEDESLSPMQV